MEAIDPDLWGLRNLRVVNLIIHGTERNTAVFTSCFDEEIKKHIINKRKGQDRQQQQTNTTYYNHTHSLATSKGVCWQTSKEDIQNNSGSLVPQNAPGGFLLRQDQNYGLCHRLDRETSGAKGSVTFCSSGSLQSSVEIARTTDFYPSRPSQAMVWVCIWPTDFIWVVLSSLRFDIGFVIWAFSSKNDNTLTKKR